MTETWLWKKVELQLFFFILSEHFFIRFLLLNLEIIFNGWKISNLNFRIWKKKLPGDDQEIIMKPWFWNQPSHLEDDISSWISLFFFSSFNEEEEYFLFVSGQIFFQLEHLNLNNLSIFCKTFFFRVSQLQFLSLLR